MSAQNACSKNAKMLQLVRFLASKLTSQTSDVGSIPIARSRNPVDAVGFTGFPPQKSPLIFPILDAVGREIRREI